MENKEAKKRIDNILKDIESNGIVITTLVEQLQELRPYAVDEKIPLLAKVIRLTFEHLENNEGFFIPIPDDEPIEDTDSENDIEGNTGTESSINLTDNKDTKTEVTAPEIAELSEDFDPIDSLSYLISLMKDVKNKINATDLRAYCNALIAYDA